MARKPVIKTLEEALNLQKELYSEFYDLSFQDELEEIEAKHGKAYANLTREHTELFLSVQNRILPKYGYAEGQQGVAHMFQDVSRFNSDKQFRRNRFMLNQLLGLLSPEEEAEIEEEEAAEQEGSIPAGWVEVIVHHFAGGTEDRVRVPPDATFQDVRQILAKETGRPEIMEKGRLMRKQEGVFSAYSNKDPLGSVREVTLLLAGQREAPPDSRPLAERLSSVGLGERGRAFGGGLLLGLPGSLSQLAERGLRSKQESEPSSAAMGASDLGLSGANLQGRAAREGGRLLVFGGEDGGRFHETVELLQSGEGAFVPGPSMSCQRGSCAAVALGEQRVIVVGGCVGTNCLNTTEVLDLQRMTFSPGPSMDSSRAGCAAAQLDQRRIIIVGGRDRSARLDSTEILDLETMAFAPGPKMSTRRAMCAAVLVDHRQLLVVGGHDGSTGLNTTEVLDLDTMRFSAGPCLGSPRFSCAAVALTGRVLVLGGVDNRASRLRDSELLDITAQSTTPGPSMGLPRSGHAAVMMDSGHLMVLGGVDGSTRHDSTEVLDVSSMRFTTGPRMAARRGGCAALLC